MNIIERTKQYLSDSGIPQYQLAKTIGVHPVTLSRFLNRTRRTSVYDKLDQYLAEQESQGTGKRALPSQPMDAHAPEA